MSREGTGLSLATGVLGAITLGVVLIPVRTLTAASNLAFVFLLLTIVIAELGGRAAAVATALVSAMSLNFFLIEPYLTLAISKSDDIIAFVALAVCGLVAAAFGRRRARAAKAISRSRRDLDTLQRMVRQLEAGAPLQDVLHELRHAFRLGRLVLRDAGEGMVAASPSDPGTPPIPDVKLQPDTLLAQGESEHELGTGGFRLPGGGGRLPLKTARGMSLDIWEGNREGLGLEERQALSIAASMLGLWLVRG